MSRYFYTGDNDIREGGTFYCLENWSYDFVDFVRATPCSDAGGPNNEFWVEIGTVSIPDPALGYGKYLRASGLTDWYEKSTRSDERRHILFEALLGYGCYDIEESRRIRIGKLPESHSFYWDERQPDDILRGNVSLRRYVRSVARNGF